VLHRGGPVADSARHEPESPSSSNAPVDTYDLDRPSRRNRRLLAVPRSCLPETSPDRTNSNLETRRQPEEATLGGFHYALANRIILSTTRARRRYLASPYAATVAEDPSELPPCAPVGKTLNHAFAAPGLTTRR